MTTERRKFRKAVRWANRRGYITGRMMEFTGYFPRLGDQWDAGFTEDDVVFYRDDKAYRPPFHDRPMGTVTTKREG